MQEKDRLVDIESGRRNLREFHEEFGDLLSIQKARNGLTQQTINDRLKASGARSFHRTLLSKWSNGWRIR